MHEPMRTGVIAFERSAIAAPTRASDMCVEVNDNLFIGMAALRGCASEPAFQPA